jgi:hypothetical protein
MDKQQFFDSRTIPELTAIAEGAGTTYENLRLILTHDGSCSPRLALALDQSSGGKLSKKMLRPDIFGTSKVA